MTNVSEFLVPAHVKARKSWTGSFPPEDLLMAIKSGEWIVEEKVDGSWYQFVTDGHGNSKLLSRRVSKVTGEYIDRAENVPHIIKYLELIAGAEALVVQGEAMNYQGFSSSSGIMGSNPDKALWSQTEGGTETIIRFLVHDMLMVDGVDLRDSSYATRRQMYQTLFGLQDLDTAIVKPIHLFDHENIKEILCHVEVEGVEGLMLKRPDIVFGGTDGIRKFKKTWTEDVYVIGWEKGTGKYSKCIGYLVCVTKDRKVVRVGGGLTDDNRTMFMDFETPYVIELVHYGRQKNSLRHPQMLKNRFHDSVSIPKWVYGWASRFDKEGLKGVRK